MKRWIGIASMGLFLALVTLWPSGIFAQKSTRGNEIKRVYLAIAVPEAAPPVGSCAGSFVHCVKLSWTPPALDISGSALTGTISYDVFRSTTSGTGYVKISTAPVSGAAFEDDTVTGGVTYFYVIVAYQTIGTAVSTPSVNSGQLTATGLPIPTPNPPTAGQAVSF